MAVHAPIPPGGVENVSKWGWPNEKQSWTWPGEEGKELLISVYANAQEVRLELNGETVGVKPVSPETKLTASFEVPYVPGELKAVALSEGKIIETKVLRTAGKPTSLRLSPDRKEIRASRNDLSYITLEIVDERGDIVPDATVPVRLSVAGDGELTASGNANPYDMKSFRNAVFRSYNGRGMAILRPYGNSGSIKLMAEAEGMEPISVTINVVDEEGRTSMGD